MRDLIILGTCVHAGEMAEVVQRINERAPAWNLLGFIGAPGQPIGGQLNGHPILGGEEALSRHPQALLAPEYEWPRGAPLPRERLASLVDPSAFVSRTAAIGVACVVYPHGFVGLNARLGDWVFCLAGCVVNHDAVLGDRVALASGVTLAGGVQVEEDCYLGQGCTVKQDVRIGRGSLVGMGAVVVRDVAPNSVVVGNPARYLRPRC